VRQSSRLRKTEPSRTVIDARNCTLTRTNLQSRKREPYHKVSLATRFVRHKKEPQRDLEWKQSSRLAPCLPAGIGHHSDQTRLSLSFGLWKRPHFEFIQPVFTLSPASGLLDVCHCLPYILSRMITSGRPASMSTTSE